MLKDYYIGIFQNRYILFSLVNRDLIQKYRRSILGIAWSIITPLGLAIIVGAVYGILFETPFDVIVPLIFAGINPWTFMAGCADGGTNTFLSAEGYIKQSTVSLQIFPLRITITNFITLMYSIITFFGIYLFMKPDLFSANMLMVFPGLIIVFFFSWGMTNITSIINLYIRDFQPFQSLILQGLFYVTPIIYPVDMIAKNGGDWIYKFNPFYYMLEVVRMPMLGHEMPTLQMYLIAVSISLVVYIVSIVVVMANKKTIAYRL
ncbi:MAG: ABC transporter permease [Bacteroides sp.]|nr:ABC transporter permease [Bacteroides sp.]